MKKSIVFFSIVLLSLAIIGCTNKENEDTNGNTETDILEYLHEPYFISSIGNENIYIVDTIILKDSKLVGFASDKGQGYIRFIKDKKGNYIMNDSMARELNYKGIGMTDFFISAYNGLSNPGDTAYIVISNGNNNVSKIELSINDKYKYSKSIEVGKASMIVFEEDLPERESKAMSIKFRYFDINNIELTDEVNL